MYKSLCTLLLAGSMVIAQNNSEPPAAPPPPASPVPTSQETLAEMGDYKLTVEDFARILQMVPANSRQKLTAEQRQQLVKGWMQVVAFAGEASAQNMDKDPEFLKQLEMYRTQLLSERYQRKLLAGLQVTEEEKKVYYDGHKDQFKRPAQYRVSRILLPTKAKADEVRQALGQGTSFEQLVKEHSIDGASKEKGGDLGWIKPGSTEPTFEEVLSGLALNQISEPFATQLGWQVVKLTEKRDAVQMEYAEVEKLLGQQLLRQKQMEVITKAGDDLLKKNDAKIYDSKN